MWMLFLILNIILDSAFFGNKKVAVRAPQARAKAPRVWGGGAPLPTGGGGCAPSPEKFLFSELKMASFRAFLLLFL